MLKLLLDEHISPEVAGGLRRLNRSLVVHWIAERGNGNFLGQEDSACLLEAATERLTLVTYDRRTIPRLLKTWAEEGRKHGGVIFVDEKTISPADIGGLVWALIHLFKETGRWDWTDRVYFLRRRAVRVLRTASPIPKRSLPLGPSVASPEIQGASAVPSQTFSVLPFRIGGSDSLQLLEEEHGRHSNPRPPQPPR